MRTVVVREHLGITDRGVAKLVRVEVLVNGLVEMSDFRQTARQTRDNVVRTLTLTSGCPWHIETAPLTLHAD